MSMPGITLAGQVETITSGAAVLAAAGAPAAKGEQSK
jgi:hypothetical protein